MNDYTKNMSQSIFNPGELQEKLKQRMKSKLKDNLKDLKIKVYGVDTYGDSRNLDGFEQKIFNPRPGFGTTVAGKRH